MGGGDIVFAANGLSARVPGMMVAVVVEENGEVILVMVTA